MIKDKKNFEFYIDAFGTPAVLLGTLFENNYGVLAFLVESEINPNSKIRKRISSVLDERYITFWHLGNGTYVAAYKECSDDIRGNLRASSGDNT